MRKRTLRAAGSIRKTFTLWFIVIIAISVGFFAGVELVLARLGLLGELDTMGKAIPVILSSLLILPFGIGTAIFALRFPMRPVRQLLHGMNRLAEGHFEERLDFGDVGPMKELADTFNTLAGELQNTEMLRSDFVNNFSHEFKTPLVSIHGFAQLLQKGQNLTDDQREYVDVIADESMRLAYMATNVLNLTKIENQSILTNAVEFNLSEQLRKCILLLEKKWAEKELSFTAEFGEHFVQADQELLKQVWVNLLDNAIKFSPRGREIGVEIRRTTEGTQITVANHGPMITQDEQKRLYDKFWQGDTSHAAQGTGIGLSVVKKIVELHKGSIAVRSNEQETAFIVTLPDQTAAQE